MTSRTPGTWTLSQLSTDPKINRSPGLVDLIPSRETRAGAHEPQRWGGMRGGQAAITAGWGQKGTGRYGADSLPGQPQCCKSLTELLTEPSHRHAVKLGKLRPREHQGLIQGHVESHWIQGTTRGWRIQGEREGAFSQYGLPWAVRGEQRSSGRFHSIRLSHKNLDPADPGGGFWKGVQWSKCDPRAHSEESDYLCLGHQKYLCNQNNLPSGL